MMDTDKGRWVVGNSEEGGGRWNRAGDVEEMQRIGRDKRLS